MILLNGKPINITKFPDKTSQVWKLDLDGIDAALINWHFEDEAEIMHLAQLAYLLRHKNIKMRLMIWYMPYARQDKLVSNSTTFALYPFIEILKTMKFNSINIVDPHSQKSLFDDSVTAFYLLSNMHDAFEKCSADLICYPDNGAKEKYKHLYFHPYVYSEKKRDQLTGEIKSIVLSGDVKNKTVLIVDDICDGGRTFVLLAKKLYEAGAKEVNLFVSHGLFTAGLDVLYEANIKNIFTKDNHFTKDK